MYVKGEIKKEKMRKYMGIFYAILSAISFGVMPAFAKIAYSEGATPSSVLVFRFSISAIILFLYFLFKRQSIKVTKKQFVMLFLVGAVGYTVTTQTLFVSYNYLSSGLATTLHFIYPAIVCLIGYIFLKEKMTKQKIVSLIIAIIGIYSLIAFEKQTLSIVGITIACISGITYGLNVIALSLQEFKGLDKKLVTMYISFGSAIGMIAYGSFEGTISLRVNGTLMFSYFGISIVSTIISIIFLLKAIEKIGASSASILGTFEPLISIIVGVMVFGEKVTFALVIGAILIIISAIILAMQKG